MPIGSAAVGVRACGVEAAPGHPVALGQLLVSVAVCGKEIGKSCGWTDAFVVNSVAMDVVVLSLVVVAIWIAIFNIDEGAGYV